jgi:transcriptional regulator with XRE-family HTH domain
MSVRYLGSLERGNANVSLDVIVRLADGLGIEPADLLPRRVAGS